MRNRGTFLLRMRWGFAAALLLLMAPPPASGAAPEAKRQSVPHAVQAEGRPAAEVLSAWAEFQARRSEPVAVSWDPRTGTPQSLFGRLSEAAPGESDAAVARRFVAENSRLFRLSPALRELALSSSFESPMGSHVTFRQSYGGIPVSGAEVKVHFNCAGEIVAVNNTSVPDISLPGDLDGEVHDDGEIWSAALWQIRAAIGATRADKAILQAHFLLTPTASFNQGANALVTAALSLDYTPAQVNSIRTILRNRGFTVTA